MKVLGINCSPRKGVNTELLINEVINRCIARMLKADAIIIGSPVNHADITADAKALIEVASYALGGAGKPLKHRPGAAIGNIKTHNETAII